VSPLSPGLTGVLVEGKRAGRGRLDDIKGMVLAGQDPETPPWKPHRW